MKRGGRLLAWLLALAAAVSPAAAEETARLRAYTRPAGTVYDTEPFTLVVEVQGSDLPEVSVAALPALVNLRVVAGPATGRSTAFELQGTSVRRSATVTLSYTLFPTALGAAEIPPIEVRIGSESRRTEPIRLEVAQASARSRAAVPRGREPGARAAAGSAEVLLRADAGMTEAWAGQAIPLEIKLLAAGTDVQSFSWTETPSLAGFWVEEEEVDPGAERRAETAGGREYQAYPVLRRILVPTAPGELVVGSFTGQIGVRRPTRDVFEDFFFRDRGAAVLRRTEPIRIRVKPLPETGKPSGFGGSVGSFRISAKLDRTELRVNDAVALKVTVEGEGSLRDAAAPRIEAPVDLKVFEPKVTSSTSPSRGKLRSTKTWEWVLVPLAPGEMRLPAVRFPYFDPQAGTYREASAEPAVLTVRRGEAPAGAAVAHGEIRPQREDIAFIKPLRGRLEEGGRGVHGSGWFRTLALLPLVAVPVIVAFGRRRARLSQDLGLARARRARRVAGKALARAERRAGGGEAGGFHEEVARALVEYLGDRFNRSAAGLTYDVADELLAKRGVPAELRGRVRTCLETCDFARFVPSSGEPGRRAEILEEARRLVDLLEKAL